MSFFLIQVSLSNRSGYPQSSFVCRIERGMLSQNLHSEAAHRGCEKGRRESERKRWRLVGQSRKNFLVESPDVNLEEMRNTKMYNKGVGNSPEAYRTLNLQGVRLPGKFGVQFHHWSRT
jgi:hypothetical protein